MLGGLACAGAAVCCCRCRPTSSGTALVLLAGALAGALWIALAGALRQYRGVNETISSLLLAYIAIALFKHLVEGPLRDPASLNKPSTLPLDEGLRIGGIARLRRALGPGARRRRLPRGRRCGCAARPRGFAMRVVGGNPRAAQLVGLPAHRLILAGLRARRRLRRAGRRASRWRRCTPAPTPR